MSPTAKAAAAIKFVSLDQLLDDAVHAQAKRRAASSPDDADPARLDHALQRVGVNRYSPENLRLAMLKSSEYPELYAQATKSARSTQEKLVRQKVRRGELLDFDGTIIPEIKGGASEYRAALTKLTSDDLGPAAREFLGKRIDIVTARPPIFHDDIRETATRMGLDVGDIHHGGFDKTEKIRELGRPLIDNNEEVVSKIHKNLGPEWARLIPTHTKAAGFLDAVKLLSARAPGPGLGKMLQVRRALPVTRGLPPGAHNLRGAFQALEDTATGDRAGKVFFTDSGSRRHELAHAYTAFIKHPKNPLWNAAGKGIWGNSDSVPAELHARIAQFKSVPKAIHNLLRDAPGYQSPGFSLVKAVRPIYNQGRIMLSDMRNDGASLMSYLQRLLAGKKSIPKGWDKVSSTKQADSWLQRWLALHAARDAANMQNPAVDSVAAKLGGPLSLGLSEAISNLSMGASKRDRRATLEDAVSEVEDDTYGEAALRGLKSSMPYAVVGGLGGVAHSALTPWSEVKKNGPQWNPREAAIQGGAGAAAGVGLAVLRPILQKLILDNVSTKAKRKAVDIKADMPMTTSLPFGDMIAAGLHKEAGS